MAKMVKWTVGSLGSALLISFAACASEEDDIARETSADEGVPEARGPALVGRERLHEVLPQQLRALGEARLGRVFDLGKARFQQRDVAPVAVVDDQNTQELPTSGVVSMIVGQGDRNYLWEFEPDEELSKRVSAHLDSELQAIAKSMEAAALERGSADGQKNVVGTEGRTRQGISDGVAANSWMAAVGLLTLDTDFTSHQCTGTLIRSDVVLTAAHCLVGYDGSTNPTWYARKLAFHPRADKTQSTTYPWGNWRWRTGSYYFPAAFTNANCHKPGSYAGGCQESDWALIRVTKPSSASGHNLYMAVATQTIAGMNDLKNRGYPNCAYNPKPASCLGHTLYGDQATCTLGTTVGNDNNYATRVSHSCDASVGHSGSALYQYLSGVPTIGGVHITDSGVFSNIDANNWMRRVTPTMLTTINNTIPTLP